jgi:hypothetical protein
MAKELGRSLPPVIATVHIGDGDARQLFVRDLFQTPDIHSVHLSYRRFGSDPEGAHAAVLAEVVLVLLGIEDIPSQLCFPCQQAKAAFPGYRWPEASSPADGAVAPIGALRKVEIGLEPDRATVTTALVGLQHDRASLRAVNALVQPKIKLIGDPPDRARRCPREVRVVAQGLGHHFNSSVETR